MPHTTKKSYPQTTLSPLIEHMKSGVIDVERKADLEEILL